MSQINVLLLNVVRQATESGGVLTASVLKIYWFLFSFNIILTESTHI